MNLNLDGASVFLTTQTRGRLFVPGHESSTRSAQLIRRWGLVRESVPGSAHWWWGGLDGEAFLGRLWMFFLGGRGRGRGPPGCVFLRSFRRTNGLQTALFVFYIICWVVEVSFQHVFRPSRKGVPRSLDSLDRHVWCLGLRQPADLFTLWRQWRGHHI